MHRTLSIALGVLLASIAYACMPNPVANANQVAEHPLFDLICETPAGNPNCDTTPAADPDFVPNPAIAAHPWVNAGIVGCTDAPDFWRAFGCVPNPVVFGPPAAPAGLCALFEPGFALGCS